MAVNDLELALPPAHAWRAPRPSPALGTSRYQARYSSLTRRFASPRSRLKIGFTAADTAPLPATAILVRPPPPRAASRRQREGAPARRPFIGGRRCHSSLLEPGKPRRPTASHQIGRQKRQSPPAARGGAERVGRAMGCPASRGDGALQLPGEAGAGGEGKGRESGGKAGRGGFNLARLTATWPWRCRGLTAASSQAGRAQQPPPPPPLPLPAEAPSCRRAGTGGCGAPGGGCGALPTAAPRSCPCCGSACPPARHGPVGRFVSEELLSPARAPSLGLCFAVIRWLPFASRCLQTGTAAGARTRRLTFSAFSHAEKAGPFSGYSCTSCPNM